jgi:SAM-dependent methyltransferase
MRRIALVGALGAFLALVVAAVHGIRRHGAGGGGHFVAGGILVNNPGAYDAFSHRLLFGSLFGPIARDTAAVAPTGGKVLEVGCGPGHLALRLAQEHDLEVTGLDLDPGMIKRARAHAEHAASGRRPSFVVGDVAALPFPDASFDVVVSTLSMHHWSDPIAGVTEIGRVLKPTGKALIWDFRGGSMPLHRDLPDPLDQVLGSPLDVVGASPWRWPWRFTLLRRVELAPRSAP